jgi:transcription antitermination factor NusG
MQPFAAENRLWYAVRVRSKCEFLANQILENKGFETFLPTYTSKRIWSDRVKHLSLPLYPGYVFCRFEFEHRLPVLQSHGVVDVVNDGRRGLSIPEHELSAVRRIVESDLKVAPWPFLQVGQHVEVHRGPLQGVEGILLAQKKNYRLVVSITLLQRSVNVEIEGDWVRPVNSPAARLSHYAQPR